MPDIEQRRIKTLEAIYNEAVDSIVTIDRNGTIVSVNPRTLSMFGFDEQDLIGQNVKILMPQPYRDAHDGYLQKYHETGQRKIIGIGREVVGRRKDGTTFPIHLAVSEIQVGEERMFAGVMRDLTEFKRLEAQETSLGRIVENSLNEIFIFDTQTLRFVLVNRGARDNLGYTIDELRTMTPVDIKPEYTAAKFRERLAPLVSGEVDRLQFDTLHQRKDGSTYQVHVHLQMTVYQEREVFVAIILDITQRREAERAVEQQRESMQADLKRLVETRTAELRDAQSELVQAEKFSTLGKVSGGIAHEIRNPLNAVKTSAYFLLNAKEPSAEKTREHLERIDRQVSMIDGVVTALSDVAKLPTANLLPVDLADLLKRTAASIDMPASVSLDLQLPADLPKALADENQVTIAFKNLIRNARDAMADAGGTLLLTADVDSDAVVVHVSDTGCGIDADDLEKILEPLFTTKARGMGLGLSITRTIVGKNQGKLTVESELGAGSRFSIELQRADQPTN